MQQNTEIFENEMGGRRLLIKDFSKAIRHMPYFETHNATNLKPILFGIHVSENAKIQFTFKFSDKCYLMRMSWKKSGTLPMNKNGFINLRCKFHKCHAKAQIKYKNDMGHLTDWGNFKHALRDTRNWETREHRDIPHTCGSNVKFFYSDSENFGYDYIEKRLHLMPSEIAFTQTRKEWRSGISAELDGAIAGLKVNYKNFIFLKNLTLPIFFFISLKQ